MLSIPRQALRAAIPCVRPVQSFRLYTTDNNNNNNNSNNSGSRKMEGTEALMNILSGSSSSQQTPRTTTNSNTSKGSSAALIMETLSKATDRQQQASRSTSFLSSKNTMGGSNSFGGAGGYGRFLSDVQTCSHNLHIHASMNNTILTLTDSQGDPITTQSAGSAGFKKSARSGPEAGYQAMTKLIEKVQEKNVQIHSLHVLMKGFGPGRDSAFKAIRAKTEWDIKRISDTTPIPFNGCRPPKARRL